MATVEIPVCACGVVMVIVQGGDNAAFACDNCDYVQQQEFGRSPKPRRETDRDTRFRHEMAEREFEWYRKNGGAK